MRESVSARPNGERDPLRVLALISNESISGPGRQLAALAVAMRPHHVDIHVAILHRQGNPRPPFADYLASLDVSHEMIEDRGPLDLRIPGALRRVIARTGATLLQTHGYKASAAAWAVRARGDRTPWVGFFHGETDEDLKARVYHWLDHRMLAAADRVVVMSARQEQSFRRIGGRVQVIHNAVLPAPPLVGDDDGGRIAELAATLERPVMGVVGRLSREKGVDIFLDACRLLHADGYRFSALIAGDGPDLDNLRASAAAAGLLNAIHFLGAVRNIAALYAQLDLLVIPSRSEGLPNVLLEAMQADVPVVSTPVGAVAEVLSDPMAGVVVNAVSAEQLARAIPPAARLKEDLEAGAARARTAAAFAVERRVERHLELYTRLALAASTGAGRSASTRSREARVTHE